MVFRSDDGRVRQFGSRVVVTLAGTEHCLPYEDWLRIAVAVLEVVHRPVAAAARYYVLLLDQVSLQDEALLWQGLAGAPAWALWAAREFTGAEIAAAGAHYAPGQARLAAPSEVVARLVRGQERPDLVVPNTPLNLAILRASAWTPSLGAPFQNLEASTQ